MPRRPPTRGLERWLSSASTSVPVTRRRRTPRGFTSAAPQAEEAKEPRKTIPRAVILSALLIGLFYLFCYYAATVYFGPNKMADPKNGFALFSNNDSWSGMAQAVWGPGLIIVILAVLFAVRNPSRIADTGRVFLDDPARP